MNKEGKAGIAGGGVVVALAWLWNEFVPNHKMPAEVAAAIVPMIGYFVAWVVEKITGGVKNSIEPFPVKKEVP